MKKALQSTLAIFFAIASIWVITPTVTEACGGTPRPLCNRTIWLGKSVPTTVAIRPDGSATVQIVLLPYVTWSNACPNPTAASLAISMQCVAIGGGPRVRLGPVTVPVNVPTAPGRQALVNGTNTFTWQLPPGTFNPAGRYRCLITGNYNVAFPASRTLPFPLITGVGDATLCMVPESPVSNGSDLPELRVTYIKPDSREYLLCRRGDQAFIHYLVENNHPTQSVTLDLTSVGRQTALLPANFAGSLQAAYDSSVSAISNPAQGTDVFPTAFADTLPPNAILPGGDPGAVNPYELNRRIRLGPCEARIVTIAVRSHGMCADGSCNERDMDFRGLWENGDSAIGCASSMVVVGSVFPKTPLCEVFDEIKTDKFTQAQYTPARYVGLQGELEHSNTHPAGNLPPAGQVVATVLDGDSLQQAVWPSSATDYVRVPEGIVNVGYLLIGSPQAQDFVPFQNQVTIFNLHRADGPIEIPFIYGQPSEEGYTIDYDAANDSLIIHNAAGQNVYNGNLTAFLTNPPRGVNVEPGTCRRFTKIGEFGTPPWIAVLPRALSRLLSNIPATNLVDEFDVIDALRDEPARWAMDDPGSGLALPSLNGIGTLPVGYDPTNLPPFPATTVAWMEVGSSQAINDPVFVPIALRVKPVPELIRSMQLEQVDFVSPFERTNSTQGIFSVEYDPVSTIQFLNVMARRPDDPRSERWIVQNMPLIPFDGPEMVSYWFDLADLGIRDGNDVDLLEIYVDIGPNISPIPPPGSFTPIDVNDFIYDVYDGAPELDLDPFKTTPLEPIVWTAVRTIDTVYRGCKVPNIDLDSSRFNPTSRPGYAGDKNACGPAAASNSLQWLQKTIDALDSTTNHRDMTEELSEFMRRQNERGVNTRNLVRGKLALIDKYKLPIRVKFQSKWEGEDDIDSPDTTYRHKGRNDNADANDWPTWDYFWQEMKDGEDVEILFGWYDTTGTRRGGHWVVATGAIHLNDSIQRLWVKDDKKQRDSGGTRQQILRWDTTAEGIPVLEGWANTTRELRIESVVSESYDTTVTFPTTTTEGIRFSQLDFIEPFTSPNSSLGLFDYQTNPSTTTQYLNVYARRSLDDDPIWLVQNMILPPFPESELISYWINYTGLEYQPGEEVEEIWIIPELDDEVLISFNPASLPDQWERHPVVADSYVVGNGHLDSEVVPFINFRLPGPVLFAPIVTADTVYRGCTVPNIDLDSSRNRPDTGYAGDWNACGPAAAANSLHWLEQIDPRIDSTTTHREKLRELSKMMGRANNSGVIDEQFIKGKLAFIDKYKLPIHVKFQSRWRDTNDIPSPDTTGSNGDSTRGGYGHKADNKNGANNAEPTWEFLVQEMKAGEDVELVVQWIDSMGRNAGAHVVTITGLSNETGAKKFWYKDDRHQHRAGGMQQPQVTWDTTNGRPIIREMGMNDTLAYVTIIYSESYDSTVKFDTIAGTSSVPVIGEAPEFGLSVVRNPSSRDEAVDVLFTLPRPIDVELIVYDLLGRELYQLADQHVEAGEHRIEWNGRNSKGEYVPSGTYLVVLRVGDVEEAVRVVRQ